MTVQIFQPVGGGGGLTIGTTTISGGTTTRLLFDAAGVVSETDGATWSATNKALTVGGATVTTSNPVLDLSQTWNAGAVAFTGLKLNITNTASASTSTLADFQVGGSSRARVTLLGHFRSFDAGLSSAAAFQIGAAITNTGIFSHASDLAVTSQGVVMAVFVSSTTDVRFGTNAIGFGSGSATATASDTFWSRNAAAAMQQGRPDAAAPVAQTTTVQSVVAGTSNTAGANWTIAGSKGTGTGAGGSIIFQTAPAGSSGTAQNALATVLTLDSTKQAAFTGHMQMTEITAPAAGAANTVRIYAEDNGAGKTRLMALFQSGAAQQIAIEP